MAISHVQSAKTGSPSSATSGSISLPVTATANNLLVATLVVRQTTASVNTPSGWTRAYYADESSKTAIFYKVAAGTETEITTSWVTSGEFAWVIAEYTGTDSTSPFDDISSSTYATATSHQAPSLAPTNAAGIAVAILAGAYGATRPVVTDPSGWTERQEQRQNTSYDPLIAHHDLLHTDTTALSPTYSLSVSTSASCSLLFFKEAGGGATTLSSPTVTSIGQTTATPQVTVTFA